MENENVEAGNVSLYQNCPSHEEVDYWGCHCWLTGLEAITR